MLPSKNSKKWFYVCILVVIVNLVVLLAGQKLLFKELEPNIILRFTVLSLLMGAIASIGYFGYKLFSYAFLAGNLAGLLYMYYNIFFNRNEWTDLIGIVGFLFIVGISVIVGISLQLVKWIAKLINQK